MKKRRQISPGIGILLMATVIVLLIVVLAVVINRYAPSKEWESLSEYFELSTEDETAVILNGEYLSTPEGESPYARTVDGSIYLRLDFLKDNMDDGYVYDETNGILRYCTDSQLISADLGSSSYTIDGQTQDLGRGILVLMDGQPYLSLDFVTQFTDLTITMETDPSRMVVETAGSVKEVATIKHKTQLRRFGGVKSKILKEAQKGESVTVLENYGKWSLVCSEDGVLGCVKNSKLSKTQEVTVACKLPERTYQHISAGSDLKLAWFQVTNQTANAGMAEALSNTSGLDVVSPTWFYLNDDQGGVENLCSAENVTYCHALGLQVWALVSNVEDGTVSSTAVLNSAVARDRLVKTLISQALAYDLDGLNVDMEALSVQAKDGYIEFVRELSLECEKNGILLSVDDYPPSSNTMFYNRSVQADYADYVILMAYDEHYAGSEEAGSVSSLSFVREGIEATLEEVPAEQLIVALPFYTRVWNSSADGISSRTLSMDNTEEYLQQHNAESSWLEEEGQNYAEFTEDGSTYMVWIEDAASLEKKLDLKKEYNLAGCAFWKLGFEPSSIWTLIGNY